MTALARAADDGGMSRPRVTSDPDRGVAVNSGTDPQRPRTPAGALPDEMPPAASSSDTSVPSDPFDASHQPKAPGRNEDVEGGGKGDPDDGL